MNGNFFCGSLNCGGVLLSATGRASDTSCFRGLGGPNLLMGFGSRDGLGGSWTNVASVDCLRCMHSLLPVPELIFGELTSSMSPIKLEGSSRQGFFSPINKSDDIFHGDEATAPSARNPGEVDFTREDKVSSDNTLPPYWIPSSESLSVDSCMLPDVRLSAAISDSVLCPLEGNMPHFLHVESSEFFFGTGSSSGRL